MTGPAPFLLQLDANGVAVRYVLDAGLLTIGRIETNTVQIQDDHVSRRHARIVRQGASWVLEDLDSTHHSFVNGEDATVTALKHGDRISIAERVDFIYLEREDPDLVAQILKSLKPPELNLDPAISGTTGRLVDQVETMLGQMRETQTDTVRLTRIQDEVNHKLADLQCLYDITHAINSELDVERLLNLIVTSVIVATGAERGFILLKDPQTRKLVARVARNMDRALTSVERRQFSTSIALKSVEKVETVWSADTAADLLDGQSLVDYNIRSVICTPLRAKGEVIGALYVDATQSLKRFGAGDADFFAALAAQSAIAILNAQLVESIKATIARLDRKVLELSALHNISERLLATPDRDAMLAVILDTSIDVLKAERGSLLLTSGDSDELAEQMVRGRDASGACEKLAEPPKRGVAHDVLESGEGTIVRLGPDDPSFSTFSLQDGKPRRLLCVPLRRNRETIGVLSLVKGDQEPPFTDEDLQLMASIASQAAVTVENARLYNMAVYDAVTQLHVRRYFDGWLAREFERTKRYGGELSVLLVDIDYFKKVNDTYGHPVGDSVLREVGARLKALGRAADLTARYGGEEFIVGLPQTDLAGAQQYAERLRLEVGGRSITTQGVTLTVTVSSGICSVSAANPADREELVHFADIALYAAKKGGRNRSVVYKKGMADKE